MARVQTSWKLSPAIVFAGGRIERLPGPHQKLRGYKVTETPVDPNLVLAIPTKDFFISMLIRDIELLDAVADLVDNCVDGARRTQAGTRSRSYG